MASIKMRVQKLIEKYELESVPCVVCEKNNFRKLQDMDRYGFDLSVVVCETCELVQVNPRLPQEFYDEFYEKYYRDLHDIKNRIGGLDEYFNWQYKRAEKIWPEASNSNKSLFIFEVGCSSGGMLQYFKDCGHVVKGVDLDRKYVEYGQSKGLDITFGTVDSVKFDRKPTYVIMSHIIEHLLRPDHVLKRIREIMHPRGWLYIGCPGVNDLLKYDMDFKKSLQLAHVYYFSLASLTNLLKKYGFQISTGTEKIHSIYHPSHVVPERLQSENGSSAAILAESKGQYCERMIAGHPRSGTMYMSELMVKLGIDMRHQEIGEDGTVSWQHIINNEYKVECPLVIHQVRNPLKVIASTAYTFNSTGYPLIFDCIGEPPNPHPLAIAMWTWIGWNKLIEERAKWRFKIEDYDLPELLSNLGLLKSSGSKYFLEDTLEALRKKGSDIPKTINSIPHVPTSWAELEAVDKGLCDQVKEMAVRYGYSLD